MTITQRPRWRAVGTALLLVLAAASGASAAAVGAAPSPNEFEPCVQAPNGGNGAMLPPPCEYIGEAKRAMTYSQLMAIPRHRAWICMKDPSNPDCRVPGGTHGGAVEEFSSELVLEFHGSGELEGFHRTVVVPGVQVEVHSGPQDADATVQEIPTEMVRVQGRLPAGDPDFAELTVVGGTYNGLPSPGRTLITRTEDGGYVLDSSFEVGFSIHFAGAPGSVLADHQGVIEGTTTMTAVGPPKADADTAP